MSNHKKIFNNYSDFHYAVGAMKEFQKIHNIIRKDYIELLNLTEKYILEQKIFNSLYRASLKSLFSLIEADIFGLNNIDKYDDYSDKDHF